MPRGKLPRGRRSVLASAGSADRVRVSERQRAGLAGNSCRCATADACVADSGTLICALARSPCSAKNWTANTASAVAACILQVSLACLVSGDSRCWYALMQADNARGAHLAHRTKAKIRGRAGDRLERAQTRLLSARRRDCRNTADGLRVQTIRGTVLRGDDEIAI